MELIGIITVLVIEASLSEKQEYCPLKQALLIENLPSENKRVFAIETLLSENKVVFVIEVSISKNKKALVISLKLHSIYTNLHCLKYVRIKKIFWSVFSHF